MARREEGSLQPRNRKYPWDEWFDVDLWVLSREDGDFGTSVWSFRSVVKAAASRRGYIVATRVESPGEGEPKILRIQRVDPPREEDHEEEEERVDNHHLRELGYDDTPQPFGNGDSPF